MRSVRAFLAIGIIAAALTNALAQPHLAYAQSGGSITLTGSSLEMSFTPETNSGCSTFWDSGHVGWSSSPPPTGSPFDGTYCDGAGSLAEIQTDLSPVTFVTEIDVDQTNFNNGTSVLHHGYCEVSIDGGLPITAPANPPPGNPLPTNSPISGINENATNVDILCVGNNADNTITSVTIDYTGPPPSLAPPSSGGGTDLTCVQCIYSPTGDWFEDAPKLIAWLGCQIKNLFACWLIPVLLGIWQSILDTMHAIAWSRVWLGDELSIAANWVDGNTIVLTTWLNGEIFNLGTQVNQGFELAIGANTFLIQGGSQTSFWDVLVSLFNGLSGTLQALFNALPQIVDGIANLIIAIINAVIQIVSIIVQLVIVVINFGLGVLNELVQTMSIVPVIVGTFQHALNLYANPVTIGIGPSSVIIDATMHPPPNSLDCSNPIIYHVCIGFYVLDNTVFSGSPDILNGTPVLAMGIILSEGLFAMHVLLWTINKIREMADKA